MKRRNCRSLQSLGSAASMIPHSPDEVFELVSSGLRSRHQATCGPCGSACSFDPLEMRDSDSTFEEEYAKINRDLDEEPANLHRWRAWLSMFFLVVMTGPPIAAFFLTAKEWVDPLVRLVPADDSEQVKDIFFGGTAWLVSCITNKSATKPPEFWRRLPKSFGHAGCVWPECIAGTPSRPRKGNGPWPSALDSGKSHRWSWQPTARLHPPSWRPLG